MFNFISPSHQFILHEHVFLFTAVVMLLLWFLLPQITLVLFSPSCQGTSLLFCSWPLSRALSVGLGYCLARLCHNNGVSPVTFKHFFFHITQNTQMHVTSFTFLSATKSSMYIIVWKQLLKRVITYWSTLPGDELKTSYFETQNV
ncbi:hypothetical protein NQD34_006162 [Periophthalmus magnuspinnatus]|nr:hypothetical protein NQD34_006162 [Periophthalmus magnuspinnatus]